MSPNLITSRRLLVLVPLYLLIAGDDATQRWIALGLFLLAGASDILDGWMARRMGLASPFGAFLDLVADRLLTLTAVVGLIAAGVLPGLWAGVGLMLVVRDFAVAGLNEAFPGKLAIRVSPVEKLKVALQFLGFGLLIAPQTAVAQTAAGLGGLGLCALFAAVLTVVYVRRTLALKA